MHFSHVNNESGSKLAKIGIVTALHLAVGIALVNNMNTIKSSPAQDQDIDVVMVKTEPPPPPPPPPEPPKQVQKPVTQPKIVVPEPEVVVEQKPPEAQLQAEVTREPQPPAVPGPVTPEAPPKAASDSGAMRTAVLADANGCAKPDYPARAARNGETGTVALALLVGADGRVADSRIQKSSGSRELDRAAVSALSMCKFKPATNGGVPEQGWAQIAYVWTLDT